MAEIIYKEITDSDGVICYIKRGELVRCGECKYFKDGMCYNPNTYDDEKTCGNTTADWFCADGERRTDGE